VTVTKRLVISGRVQGVGFRFYMEHKAREHGISGWVRNRRDGTVEAMIQGRADAVEAMIRSAQSGPRGAVVTDVQITEGRGDFTAFEVRPTE
jgi:acylphosphatase